MHMKIELLIKSDDWIGNVGFLLVSDGCACEYLDCFTAYSVVLS